MNIKKLVGTGLNKNDYGLLGEETNVRESYCGAFLRNGDLVTGLTDDTNSLRCGVVIKKDGNFYIMGSVGRALNTYKQLTIVVDNSLVTTEITENLHGLKIEELDFSELTVKEILDLGYNVSISDVKNTKENLPF